MEVKKKWTPNPRVVIENARLRFSALWDAESVMGSEPKYSITLDIEPGSANDKAVNAGMLEAATAKWGDQAVERKQRAILMGSKNCCYSSENQEGKPHPDGMWRLKASRPEKMGRVAIWDQANLPLTAADGKPYNGCFVDAELEVFAMDGPAIYARVIQVRFRADGPAFTRQQEQANPNVFSKLAVDDGDDLM